MKKTNQKAWLIATLELAPTLVFLSLWRNGIALETAGWTGMFVAAAAMTALAVMRAEFSPIMLGINIHLLLITPFIVSLYKLGWHNVAASVQEQAQTLIFIAIAVVGAIMTMTTKRCFIGSLAGDLVLRRRYSLYLLLAVLVAVPWAYLHAGDTLIGIAIPLALLFAFRGFLSARLDDRTSTAPKTLSVATIGSLGSSS